jgi:type II secretory pathway component PulC
MLLDKLEKAVWVIGGITVCGVILLMVKMLPSIIHTAEIEVQPVNLKIERPGTQREKPGAGKKATPAVRPNASSAQSPEQAPTRVVGSPSKKIMPSHAAAEDKKIDPIFRERYSKYASIFEETKNAESEVVQTPYGTGVRLISVVKGSIIEKVGFVPGDILVAINGRTLEPLTGSITDVYKDGERLYEELKGQELFEIEIIRNGQPVLLRYYIPLK